MRATVALEQQREYLTALHETTLGLINRLDPADLLQVIVGRATQLINGDYGWLYLVNQKEDLLEVRFATEGFLEYLGQHLHRGEGLAGVIWQTGRPQAVDDYRRWPYRSALFPPQMVRAAVGVPLTSDNQILGVLGVSITESDRTFSEAEIVLLDRFARLAAIALDNAQLFAATRRQAQELALLHQVRTETAREVELPDLIKTVVEATAQTFDYDLVSLYLLRDGALHLQHQVGYHQVLTVIPITAGVCGRVARTGEPLFLEDVHSDPTFLEAIPGITSEVCVPLFDQGQVVGVLNIEKMGATRLSEADLRILTALGQHVGSAISRARLYAEARESEQRYRSVVENVAEVIFQTDCAGNWTFLSPAWTKITGYAVADSLGRPMVEFLHPDDRAACEESRAQLLSHQNTTCRCIVRLLTQERDLRWVEGRGHMRYAEDGSPQGLLGTLTDITEQKQAEAALQQERDFALQVMGALGQGLVVTGPDGRIEYANPALARMLGAPAELLQGRLPEEFIASEGQAWAAAVSRTGETTSRELRLCVADGSTRYALWTSSPRWREGQVVGAIATGD